MNDPSAPFSDLALARVISRRLRSPRGAPVPRVEPSPRYVHFDARRLIPDSASWYVPPRAQRFGADGWNQMLDGCLSAADAESAFLMDSQGLVVTTRGNTTQEEAEGIGARLMVALDQAEAIGRTGGASSVALEFDGLWLTGLRLEAGESRLTVGIVAALPLSRDARDVVQNLIFTASEISNTD